MKISKGARQYSNIGKSAQRPHHRAIAGWQHLVVLAPLIAAPGMCRAAFAQSGGRAAAVLAASPAPAPPGEAAPLTLTLSDALARAQQNAPQFLSAVTSARLAHEGRLQARAALLPSANLVTQYLNTQGNGRLPSGRYVTNDGVHVYRQWGVFHQDLSPARLSFSAYRRAAAADELARAQQEVALRGLRLTVTQDYYALLVAQRKYATTQTSLNEAKRFLKISQDLERGGEVAHSDVIKFQLQANQAQRAFEDAKVAMDGARLGLAVLLSPNFNQDFTVVDDLDQAPALPPFPDARRMAADRNPQLRAALQSLRAANLDVTIAREAFLPAVIVDLDYGIEANAFALRSRTSADRAAGRQPNLGYFLTASLSMPVWDWGATRSKLRQAEDRRGLARVQLAATERQVLASLYGSYQEAETAQAQLNSLRDSANLANESLRLNTLRYQAGEATVLEVVDAANTLSLARNAYDDGEARYRVALASLQTLTGPF